MPFGHKWRNTGVPPLETGLLFQVIHQGIVQIQGLGELGKEDDFFAVQVCADDACRQIHFGGECGVAVNGLCQSLRCGRMVQFGFKPLLGLGIVAAFLQNDLFFRIIDKAV